jgi:hypothetical protein
MPAGAICATRGQLEDLGMGHLEGRAEVHLGGLRLDGLHDARPRMAGVHAPQAGHAVQDLAAAGVPVVHAFGALQQARGLLELPVGGEGHPVGAHVGRRWPPPGAASVLDPMDSAACIRAGSTALFMAASRGLAKPRV